MIKKELNRLENVIKSENILFQGAGVIITANKKRAHKEGDILVVTEHAKELSCLFRKLKDVFCDYTDYYNKYSFYGRLAEAANESIARGDGRQELLLAVKNEAKKMEAELDKIYYFAYGSNMNVEQMNYRCPGAKPIGNAVLSGYRFALDRAGVATVIRKDESEVQGVLWLIDREDEKSLDIYEGVSSGCYEKVGLKVKTKEREFCPLVYVSLREEGGDFARSGYMEAIIEAAEKWELDEDYLKVLQSN